MVSGLIVSQYIDTPSHFQSNQSLSQWFKKEKIPLLEIKDTRFLTQYLREKGAMLGKIIFDSDIPYYNPNSDNLVDKVSTKKISYHKGLPTKQHKSMTVLLIDCGAKRHIRQALLERGVNVITCPWDFNPFTTTPLLNSLPQPQSGQFSPFDAIVISNGPGDPTMVDKTIQTVRQALTKGIPTLGICLGHQILSLAAGGETKKLQYGHRSQNQPCVMNGSPRCYITTQNHGFAVSTLPTGFKAWFTNANDNTNEGIIHEKLPFMSVQFHPEATPGPTDTEWIFDYFLHSIRNTKV
jgi:carbamoyl-phosphate synthase small subunit